MRILKIITINLISKSKLGDKMAFDENMKIWMDGEFKELKDANISILAHVVHYGSAVFEGIRCYDTPNGPAIFRVREHMQRLINSAKIYKMEIPYTLDELVEACKDTVRENNLKGCYIRPITYRGFGELGVNPLNCPAFLGLLHVDLRGCGFCVKVVT